MSRMMINGQVIETSGSSNITVNNDGIFVDGKLVTQKEDKLFRIELEGDLSQLNVYGVGVTVKGDVGPVTSEGSVNCETVIGDVIANGSVNCDDIYGNVKSLGSVNCDNIEGDVRATGSINY